MLNIKGDAYSYNIYFNNIISVTLPWILHE